MRYSTPKERGEKCSLEIRRNLSIPSREMKFEFGYGLQLASSPVTIPWQPDFKMLFRSLREVTTTKLFGVWKACAWATKYYEKNTPPRSEEHTSELQSQFHLLCRLLLLKKKKY